ncbi:MAG: hypothetical protein ACRD18_09685 [Terriglobia bacterium]
MVQIDVPIAFAVGSFFADAAQKQLQSTRVEYHFRAMLKNNIFQIFFFSWIPVYFMLNFFGWETTHMWWHADSVAAYPYFVPLFIVIFFGVANAGFLVGKWLVSHGRILANRLVYTGIVVYAAVWVLAQTGSTLLLGTYAQWKESLSPLFYQDPTFLGMLIFSMIVWIAGLAIFYFSLRREGKRLPCV